MGIYRALYAAQFIVLYAASKAITIFSKR